nr:DMT family transporter [Rhodovibrio salinarum]
MRSSIRADGFPSQIALWAALGGTLFALIWSLSFVVTRLALPDIPPVLLAAIRLIASGALLVAFRARTTLATWRAASPATRRTIILAGLLAQAVYLGAAYWALTAIPTSVVNIVVSALPLLTIPAAFLVLRERASLIETFAVVLGVTGVAIAVFDTQSMRMVNEGAYTAAAMLLLVAVAALALGNTLVKRIVTARNYIDICGPQFLTSGVVLLVVSLILETTPGWDALARALPELGYLVLLGSIVGMALWFKLLSLMTANQAASFFLMTPIMGMGLGALFFGELMTTSKIIGVVVLMASISLKVMVSFANKPND